MNVESAIKMLAWNIALPVGIAVAVLFALTRFLPERYSSAIAFCAGAMTGYLLLDWAKVVPERHFQWLPWLAILALIPAALSLRENTHVIERLLGFVPIAAITAFLIVPSWNRLDDVRWACLFAVAGCVWVQCGLWDFLAARMKPLLFAVLAALSLGGAAGLSMAFVSSKYGEMLLCSTGAVTGIGLLSLRCSEATRSRAIAPLVAVTLTAGAFIGFIGPDPSQPAFLVPLLIPLGAFPLAIVCRERRWLGFAIQVLVAVALLGGSAWWIQSQQSAAAGEYGDYY